MSACIIFQGYIDPDGYGRTPCHQRAHRAAYVAAKGPIPAGLTIDHLCRVRACINPDHLEAVTRRVNTLRGLSPTAINARKVACNSGHPFDEANTYYSSVRDRNGRVVHRRTCRACNALAVRNLKERKQGVAA